MVVFFQQERVIQVQRLPVAMYNEDDLKTTTSPAAPPLTAYQVFWTYFSKFSILFSSSSLPSIDIPIDTGTSTHLKFSVASLVRTLLQNVGI